MKFFPTKAALFCATSLLALSLSSVSFAGDVEVRDWSEIQAELDRIIQNKEVQKVLNHKEVRKVVSQIQRNLDALEAQVKAEAENKVDQAQAQAQALVQDRWDMTVGKLIDDYKKSDIPRKLEQGDWDAIEETKALLRQLPSPKPDNGSISQSK